jgi:hypothetical protein
MSILRINQASDEQDRPRVDIPDEEQKGMICPEHELGRLQVDYHGSGTTCFSTFFIDGYKGAVNDG